MTKTATQTSKKKTKSGATRKRSTARKTKEEFVWTPSERAAWKLPERVTVSEHADKYRILDSESSAEPGRYRTDRTPYMRGVMDSFNDPEVEVIVLVKPPQSGGTEGVFNMISYVIDQDPSPTLLVMPRDTDCTYIANKRLKPMVQLSPQLRSHVGDRIWDLSSGEFTFDRMTLYFAGSNSPAGLSSKPIRYLFCDEVDKFPLFAGKEASPIDLGFKRTITFWDAKKVIISTPTTESGAIWQWYQRSNMQEYYIPCPHCGLCSVWQFSQLKVPKGLRDPDEIRQGGEVWYECIHCSGRIDEGDKAELTAGGKWVPAGRRVLGDGTIEGEPKRSKRISGFHFNALISPWVSWLEIMAQWFEANTADGIALGKLMDFNNAMLALPWAERGRTIESDAMTKKIRPDVSRRAVPVDVFCLVAGADYHENELGEIRVDYEVRGYAPGLRSYVITSGSVDSWESLEDEVLMLPFPWASGRCSKEELAVVKICVDSGYHPDEVYDWCEKFPGIAVPTKGTDNQRTPLVMTELHKVLERAANKRRRRKARAYRGMVLYTVHTNYFKDQVTSWAQAEGGQVASTEYYAECPEVYFREFCNEQKVRKKGTRGQVKFVWEPVTPSAATHFLDTAVAAAVAGYLEKVHLVRAGRSDRVPAAVRRRRARPARKKQPSKSGGYLSGMGGLL